MKIKETRIELILWIGFLTIIAGFLFGLLSCSSAEQLTAPNHNDKMVVWCDYDYIYCIDKPLNDTVISFEKKDVQEIKNSYHDALTFGTFLICKNEFRKY